MPLYINSPNSALIRLISNQSEIVTLDANFLIPPSRNRIEIPFDAFRMHWLDPLFSSFTQLFIHEAVYEELISIRLKSFIDTMLDCSPPRLRIHQDRNLSPTEAALRNRIESSIAPTFKYNPVLDNKADRGEVKTLAFISAKGYLYFASHDNQVIRLIESSRAKSNGLENLEALQMYEMIYLLNRNNPKLNKGFRMLYKYYYFMTNREKAYHPPWEDFIKQMDSLYLQYFP